jgi:DNA-binding transcriptional LysR family regulator
MMLDPFELQAVVVLAEELHFGRAAGRLHLSQPALSKQIRRIEEKVGGPLFVRGYREVRTTEAGRVLALRGRLLLADMGGVLDETCRVVRGEGGLLKIGFGIAVILGLLPDVLLRFRARHPAVELRLRDMSTPAQIAALLREDIDVGFLRLPVDAAGLATRPVLRERLVAAIGPRTTWRTKDGVRSLAREPFVVCARAASASYYDHVTSVCRAAGFTPTIVQETGELYTVLALVRAGIGVALVPRAAAGMRLPGIRFREVSLPQAQWDIGVAGRHDRPVEPLVERFVDVATGFGRARSSSS